MMDVNVETQNHWIERLLLVCGKLARKGNAIMYNVYDGGKA